MVAYAYKPNAILAEPLKNRTGTSILEALERVYNRLVLVRLKPTLHILDNKVSSNFKKFLSTQDVEFQLVPPHTHQKNAAERAIQTFKNHFVASLCSVHSKFPMYLWDCLFPQATLTLNLLHSS